MCDDSIVAIESNHNLNFIFQSACVNDPINVFIEALLMIQVTRESHSTKLFGPQVTPTFSDKVSRRLIAVPLQKAES